MKRTKHTFRFREGDVKFLQEMFPALGANQVIQTLVSNFVDKFNRPISDEQVVQFLKEEEKKNG